MTTLNLLSEWVTWVPVGIFNTEGGLSQELHGVGALGAGYDYISPATFQEGMDVSSYSNIQRLHTSWFTSIRCINQSWLRT